MAGRFEGLKDAERKLFENIFPGKDRRGRGMPAARPRKILNSPQFILAAVPVARSSAGIATGIGKRKPSLAQSMAS